MATPAAGLMVTPTLRLVRPLGEGGMGSVWIADHLALRTQVVVKFMSEELAKNPEAVARFAREAAAASQVKSPHVVQMLDHGVMDGGAPYIAMELLEGHDLAAQLEKSGKLSIPETIAIVAQLARALSKAHDRGIVHRDVKPSNVFLCDAGGGELFVKLLDFGIAKAQSLKVAEDTTRTGAFVGSPFYMSPEQVVGAKTVDARSDLWSVGVMTFEMLTGQKPFFADTVGGLALKIHRDPLPMPTAEDPRLPPAIDAWFARACAREPSERFQTAKEMADALAVALTGERLTPALAIESGPRNAERAVPAITASSTLQSGRTDAGVGLSTTVLPSRRGKVLVAGAILVVFVLLGFVGMRVLARSSAEAQSAAASPPPPTTSAPPTPATTSAPAPTAVPTETAIASASAETPAPAPTRTARTAGVAVTVPKPSSTPKPPPPPPPLEDDIK